MCITFNKSTHKLGSVRIENVLFNNFPGQPNFGDSQFLKNFVAKLIRAHPILKNKEWVANSSFEQLDELIIKFYNDEYMIPELTRVIEEIMAKDKCLCKYCHR